jgi:hypothetical protein
MSSLMNHGYISSFITNLPDNLHIVIYIINSGTILVTVQFLPGILKNFQMFTCIMEEIINFTAQVYCTSRMMCSAVKHHSHHFNSFHFIYLAFRESI